MKNSLVYLRPANMVSFRVMGPYEQSIPEAWDKMFAWIAKHGLSSPVGRGYGLAHDHPARVAPEQRRYDACIQLTPIFEDRALRDLSSMTLPGGPYMRQRYVGCYQGVCSVVAGAHLSIELPDDLRVDERRPLVTIYLDDPGCSKEEERRADICLPVSAASSRDRARAA